VHHLIYLIEIVAVPCVGQLFNLQDDLFVCVAVIGAAAAIIVVVLGLICWGNCRKKKVGPVSPALFASSAMALLCVSTAS
jgi:hypothetical protein